MFYLLISVLCSVSVGVFFKLIRSKQSIHIFLIALNYVVAAVAVSYFFPLSITDSFAHIPWGLVLPLIILLPGIFLFLPISIQNSGIIKTDIAQRLSLVIPILCSFWIFGETISPQKYVALALGFLSIFFILNKQSASQKSSYFLLVIFLGYGIIDVLFKQVALHSEIPYTAVLFYIFSGSALVSLLVVLFQYTSLKTQLNSKNMLFGATLGVLNFANIYFYLKAHQYFKSTPTTVFAVMNFGVVLLGTLIGSLFFKEKLSKLNIIGLFLALGAIALIVSSQK